MRKTCLTDTATDAERQDKRPEPTEEQTRLFRSCAALIAAKNAMRDHQGPYSGEEWLRKTTAHRAAWSDFEDVFNTIKGG